MANTENAGSTADVPPVRYRVSGMDCAKDAAQIERAAQAAGVAPGDVKVSAATHIMTLTAPEVRLPDIEKAVAVTGYGFDRIDGDEDILVNIPLRRCDVAAQLGQLTFAEAVDSLLALGLQLYPEDGVLSHSPTTAGGPGENP